MLDKAFEALKTYDWGAERNALDPINEAVIHCRNNTAMRKDLETRLAASLKSSISRDAKDFVCRKLMQIGTSESISTLADLLSDKNLAHMARYALERIPTQEAVQALRDALPKIDGLLKIGVISSLGQRRDAASVPMLTKLLSDSDSTIVRSAALALGAIRSPQSTKALSNAKPTSSESKIAVTDASLACAEALLSAGNKAEAMAVYKSLLGDGQPKQVRIAATRGMLACAGKS